jgi:hypothetical protein
VRGKAAFAATVMVVSLAAVPWVSIGSGSGDPGGASRQVLWDLVDLRAGPLPADEPERARGVLRCELERPGLCDSLTTLMLELPFAWHRAGYTVTLADAPPAPARGGPQVRGAARETTREIVVYVSWADTVKEVEGAFRAVARTVAHELGHAMHQSCYEPAVLAAWREVRGTPDDVPAFGHGHDGSLFNSVAEDFAELAMAWLTDGEFVARSPGEGDRFVPAFPGQAMVTTVVDPTLARAFFRTCVPRADPGPQSR